MNRREMLRKGACAAVVPMAAIVPATLPTTTKKPYAWVVDRRFEGVTSYQSLFFDLGKITAEESARWVKMVWEELGEEYTAEMFPIYRS